MLERFRDRNEAGRLLAEAVARLAAVPCVVAAIPRGGLAVALPIAQKLGMPLTLAPVSKLTSEIAPELAFGAIDVDGEVLLDPCTVSSLGLDADDIARARERVAAEIRRRIERYRAAPLADLLPRPGLVLVDDGLATGLTMRAAVAYARRHGAPRIVVAVPCASVEGAETMRREADGFASLIVDEAFAAVGAYYDDFSQVCDDEVAVLLALGAQAAAQAADPSRDG